MRLVITFFFLILQFSAIGQKFTDDTLVRVVYDVKYLTDTNTNVYFEREAELYIDGEESYFVSMQVSIYDSIIYMGMDESRYVNERVKKFRVYKDHRNNEVILYHSFLPRQFLQTTESIDDQQWIILPDTSHLFNYECQKAKLQYRGREWFAWFTSDVPIAEGPYKFSGLPGLILQVWDSQKHWFFDFKSIEYVRGRKLDISYLSPAKEISAVDLAKQQQDFKMHAMERLQAAGVISFRLEDREEIIRTSRTKSAKDNNEIEIFQF